MAKSSILVNRGGRAQEALVLDGTDGAAAGWKSKAEAEDVDGFDALAEVEDSETVRVALSQSRRMTPFVDVAAGTDP